MTDLASASVDGLAREILSAVIPVLQVETDLRNGALRAIDATGADASVATAAALRRVAEDVLACVAHLPAAGRRGDGVEQH